MSTDQNSGDNKRFMLISAADIRRGVGDIKPGWLIGSFVDADDLRYCEDFEVKDWDLRSMRTNWRNGADCGTEYIAVLDGVLTVILGRLGADGSTVEEEKEIEVRPDQRILLARGVWRKLRATDDIKAITVRSWRR
jgi:hypothetical protein